MNLVKQSLTLKFKIIDYSILTINVVIDKLQIHQKLTIFF